MSTECESVVSPSIGPDRSRSLNLPSTSMRSERHSHSGISYNGRVSVIPPYNRYEAYRAGYNYDNTSANLLNSGSFQASPGHSRMPDSLYPTYMDHSFSPMMPLLPPQSHSTPGGSKNNDTYNHQQEEKPIEIKQEKDLGYDTEDIQMDNLKNIEIEMTDLSHSTEDKNDKFPRRLDEKTKPTIDFRNSEKINGVSESLINPDLSVNVNYEDTSDFEYPDEKPSSPASDQNDPREIDTDASTLLNSYLDTTHEMIQHGENAKSLKCQYCPFSTDSTQEFKIHGIIHFDFRCVKCDYTTQTAEQLKDHLKDEHNLSSEDIIDLESVRIPKMNSQGKMKTFKCKQCGFLANIKKKFWEHAKIHIKSDKLLVCNTCPFVTEYKHHLEYHMRNHMGTKPFKCTKCSYSCVNKSMLNSHMKSHSNVYQYRCNNCSYATKYCHSLKLHLRKYNHTPAMVLNPDGTPNPVPIIDVYGTRRGPKLKKDENGMPILPPQYQLQAQFVRAQMEVTGTIPPAPTVPLDKYLSKSNGNSINLSLPPSSFTNAFTFGGNIPSYPSFIPNEFMHSESPHKNDIPDNENESEDKGEKLNLSKSPEVQETFKCDICSFSAQSKDVLSHHMLLHVNKRDEINRDIPSTICENEKVVINNSSEENSLHFQKYANELIKHHSQQGLTSQFSNTQNVLQSYIARSINPLIYSQLMGNQGFVHHALDIQHHLQLLAQQSAKENNEKSFGNGATPVKPLGQSDTVLDLSKEHTPPRSVSSHQNSSSISPSLLPASPPNFDVATPPSKNRRKGRAFKLERIALRLSGSGEEENSCGESSDAHKEQEVKRLMENNIPQLLPLELPESTNESSSIDTNEKWNDFYQCKFCDIAFKDDVMHNLHMGYHGFENPFTCNGCGFKANDKLGFFMHLFRSAHRTK